MIMACTLGFVAALVLSSSLVHPKSVNLHNKSTEQKKKKRKIEKKRNKITQKFSAVANSLFGLCGFFTKFSYFLSNSWTQHFAAAEELLLHEHDSQTTVSQPPANTMVHGGFGGVVAAELECERREKWKCDFLLPSEQTRGALKFQHTPVRVWHERIGNSFNLISIIVMNSYLYFFCSSLSAAAATHSNSP